MAFWTNIVIWVVTTLISYALTPRPQSQKPESVNDVTIPSIDEGKPIQVVFGRMKISPFVLWYGNFSTKEIKADNGKK